MYTVRYDGPSCTRRGFEYQNTTDSYEVIIWYAIIKPLVIVIIWWRIVMADSCSDYGGTSIHYPKNLK